MRNYEIDDLIAYIYGSDKQKGEMQIKYLNLFEESTNNQGSNYKLYVNPDEVKSDAVMAIDAAFKEINKRVRNYQIDRISLHKVFNKHLKRFIRENEKENMPLTKELNDKFKKTVRKKAWKGLEDHNYVENEDKLVDTEYMDELREKDRVYQLIEIIGPDRESTVYFDMLDYYIEGETYSEIAEKPRNRGISKQAVFKRLKKYIESMGKKVRRAGYDTKSR